MKRNGLAFPLVVGVLLAVSASTAFAQDAEQPSPPASLDELEERLVQILDETNTPGLGIALVSRDSVIWEAGLGLAHREPETPATAETLFRIGSISKMFAALAVLQLVEQGRLGLDDRVRDLVPDVEFENAWAETDPVLVEHLLEHTAGFDDIHIVEFASSDPTPSTLKQGLDFHPHSRTSRWRPGTQFSYSNSGAGVAAYIVEQITGQRFEDYVGEHLFAPLGMETANYLLTDAVRERLATLYTGGTTPVPYWHLVMRPPGAVNASARDMSGFVRMLLNRGELEGIRIVSEESMARMETPGSTLGAAIGLESGYALANYSSVTDGFVFRGHNGGLSGGVADLGYQPESGVGYALTLNSDNGAALQRIARLTRQFLTRDLDPPPLPPARAVPEAIAAEFEGTYRTATPRQEFTRFLLRLPIVGLSFEDDRILLKGSVFGPATEYFPVADRLARLEDWPIASLALIGEVDGATRIQVGGTTLVKVSAVLAGLELGLMMLAVLLMASAVLFALIWGPRWLFGKLRARPGIGVRAWPLLTVLLLAAAVASLVTAGGPERMGIPSMHSVGFAAGTVAFFLVAVFSVYVLWRSRTLPINRVAFWHSAAVTAANAWLAGYLLFWGIIGLRLWSF